jgi:hypothetical protein
MTTRITQQLGASFGTAIVAVALQALVDHGATTAFRSAFWWAIGITIAAIVPAVILPANTPNAAPPTAKPTPDERIPSYR